MAVSTYDIKGDVVEIIDGIFGKGVLGDNIPENISADVMILTNDVLRQLRLSNERMDELLAGVVTVGAYSSLSVAALSTKLVRNGILKLMEKVAKFIGPRPSADDLINASKLLGDGINFIFRGTRDEIKTVFTGIRNDRNYYFILVNLARNYKSEMAITLAGLW